MLEHPIQPILKTLPTLPGCYIYKDRDDTILYVGKAKNLRKRVTSYFQNYRKLTARIQIMIDNAYDVEYHSVDSEIEALILEASLIKKYKPRYNVMLKDDKSYSWIKISKDPYPIIYRTRSNSDKNAIYFGPFPDSHARDQVLEFLRKEFPYRTCSYALTPQELQERSERRKNGEILRTRLCTYYHIGRCGGPCEDQVSQDDYLDNIESIKKFLQNRKRVLIKELESKMKYFAKNLEFEKAGRVKKQVDEMNYVSQRLMIGHGDDEDDVTRLSFQRSQKGLELLIKTLKIADLKAMNKEEKADYLDNFRIECYDISNTSGTNAVGAMIVFEGGMAKKSNYRKFKINVKDTPDDFAMMNEVLTRRFRYLKPKNELEDLEKHNDQILKKLDETGVLKAKVLKRTEAFADLEVSASYYKNDESFNSVPDLIIIDGGKGQLGVAIKVLHDMKLDNLRVSGLAKRREEIYLPGEKESYLFDEKKEALFLLQRVRDETHRFGITYHRKRRSKAMFQ